ncbi:MAG: DoxX family protein [Odoribacter sp.]|nr:DoxX family protein [Odoribacter sp.]
MKNFFLWGIPLRRKEQGFLLFLLRVFIGIMILKHGAAKISNFDELSSMFADPFGMGSSFSLILSICAEVGCAVLLILGIFTRIVSLPLIINMIVAIATTVNSPNGVSESAILFLGLFIVYFFIGGERYSLDHFLFRDKYKGKTLIEE